MRVDTLLTYEKVTNSLIDFQELKNKSESAENNPL